MDNKTHRHGSLFLLSGRIISGSNSMYAGENINWQQLIKSYILNETHCAGRVRESYYGRSTRYTMWSTAAEAACSYIYERYFTVLVMYLTGEKIVCIRNNAPNTPGQRTTTDWHLRHAQMPLPLQTFPLRSWKVDMRLRTGQRWCEYQNASNDGATSKKLSQQFWKIIIVRCMSFPGQVALMVKNTPANAGVLRDLGLIPGSGRSLGGGHGNPLQYSCLEAPIDRGAWRITVHGVAKQPWTQLKWLSMQDVWMFRLDSNKAKSDFKGPKDWSHYCKIKQTKQKIVWLMSPHVSLLIFLASFQFFFFFFLVFQSFWWGFGETHTSWHILGRSNPDVCFLN